MLFAGKKYPLLKRITVYSTTTGTSTATRPNITAGASETLETSAAEEI
jgi:hypothetical protein